VDEGEQCDDGNLVNTDGCSFLCEEEICGDGVLNNLFTGEECDDGNHASGDGCSSTCELEPLSSDPEPAELQGVTRAHNEYRRALTPPPVDLSWDPTIASMAQAWADIIEVGDESHAACSMWHNPNFGTYSSGENIAGSGGSATPVQMVSFWGSEVIHPLIDPPTRYCTAWHIGNAHYCNMTNDSFTKLGCGINDCGILVCNYAP
jgi:cysteine-rich repeat protein